MATSPAKPPASAARASATEAPAHQLPPAVHAIGGSIGSALAILTFYPLERIRVELQSKGGGGGGDGEEDGATPTDGNSPEGRYRDGSFDLLDNPADRMDGPDGGSGEMTAPCDQTRQFPGDEQSKPEVNSRKNPPYRETILQCLLRLHKEQTLYKGASHMVTTMTLSNAIFFYALQVARRRLASLDGGPGRRRSRLVPRSKMAQSLVASSLAGAINVLLSNPLWVASLRIMESKLPNDDEELRRHPTLWKVMQRIARDEGLSQLWNGTRTSLLLVSNPIIQHFVYEQLRLALWESRRRRARVAGNGRGSQVTSSLSSVEAFAFGALAKTVATVLHHMTYLFNFIKQTYPLQLAQVLLRLQKKKNPSDESFRPYTGTIDCLCQQFARGGIPALFSGMNAKLLQTVLTAAFTFLTYEQTLTQVARLYEVLGVNRRRQ